MKDLKSKLEKLLTNAEDCTLIARLATDKDNRGNPYPHRQTAPRMAAKLRADIAARSQGAVKTAVWAWSLRLKSLFHPPR
jgi:hypothetical protein